MVTNMITEWLLDTHVKDLPVWMYKMPLEDTETRYSENYQVVSDLRRKTNYQQAIVHRGNFIASLQEIPESLWEMKKPLSTPEFREIDSANGSERKLLSRLLIQEIAVHQPWEISSQNSLLVGRKSIPIPKKYEERYRIHRQLTLDCNVDPQGRIYLGFHLSHRYLYQQNITKMWNEIKPGVKVCDYNQKQYVFVERDHRKISDPFEPELGGQSLLEYYANNRKFPSKFIERVKQLPPDTLAVKVKAGKDYLFPPQLLRLQASFDHIPLELQRLSKLNADRKMKIAIQTMEWVLSHCKRIRYRKSGLEVKRHGYRVEKVNKPMMVFGKGVQSSNIRAGLTKGGIYGSTSHRPIKQKYCYIIDKPIYEQIGTRFLDVNEYVRDLEKKSRQWGVQLQRVDEQNHFATSFADRKELERRLIDLADSYNDSTIVVITGQKDRYSLVKEELDAKVDCATQFIMLETAMNESGKAYTIENILLGIYVKSGIYPWVLAKPLSSDCYIGLDVSHEEGKHSLGCIQIVGKDGRVMFSRPIGRSEAGEKIDRKTFSAILRTAKGEFRKMYGQELKHLTIHRDGLGFENEIKNIEAALKGEKIQFDYVSIRKKSNRRMANLSNQRKFYTVEGIYYVKNNIAYLCATQPADTIGMANPLKIVKWHGVRSMKEIVQDIYSLSYMNVHAMNRSRLPVTINYADKSSTFFSRNMLNTMSYRIGFI